MTLRGGCHCGQVTLTLAERPDHLNACNCTLCWSLGTLWGYYRRDRVTIAGETRGYVRADLAEPGIEVRSCPTCGATVAWLPLHAAEIEARMGVNMRLFDPATLEGVELRFENMRGDGPDYYREPQPFGGVQPRTETCSR